MKLTNKEEHSLSVAVWLITDEYNYNRYPGKKHISATGLLKPTRMIILSSRLTKDQRAEQEYDISKNIPSKMGTSIHAGISHAWLTNGAQALMDLGYSEDVCKRIIVNPTLEQLAAIDRPIPIYIERRVHKEFMGYVVDGELDFLGDGVLEDFKSTGVYSYINASNDEKHRLQGSIYRWLNPELVTHDYMRIQYVFTDWKKLDAMIRKDKGYPQSRIIPKKLELLSIPETENFIKTKIMELEQYADAPEEQLPECPNDELWRSESVFKVYKHDQSKRSSGNFDTYHDAHVKMLEIGGTAFVKKKPGAVRRCGYCLAFDTCSQKDAYLEQGILTLP